MFPPHDPQPAPDFIEGLNRGFAAIAGWSFDHRWLVLSATAAFLVGSLFLVSRARIDASFESYFDVSDPAYVAYTNYRDLFGSDEISYILYEAPGAEHGVFDVEVMGRILELTKALEDEVPFIYEVRTLTNAELITGVTDGIEIRKLEDEWPLDQAALLEWRTAMLSKPYFKDGIVNHDASFGAIIIEMDRSSTDPLDEIRLDPDGGDGIDNLYPQVTADRIDEILARPEYAGIVFEHSGDVPLNAIFNVIISEESAKLGGLTALAIAIMLLLFFRSFIAALAPVVIVQLSVLLCIAIIVALGWSLDLVFGKVPTLLTAIGVAHSVHILSEFRSRWPVVRDRRTALVETFYLVGTPCLLTSITTAAGFASLSFAPIKALARQGVYVSLGVLAAFVLTVGLLTVILSFGRKTPPERNLERVGADAKGGEVLRGLLAAVAEFTSRRRREILAGFGVVFLVSVFGMTLIQVDSNWLDDFSDRVPLKAKTQHVDEVMGGLASLLYVFDTGKPEAVKNPEVLREIERLQKRADDEDWVVVKTYSIVDILKDLNQAFHADDPAHYRIPESRDLIAQYLLLYETSGGESVSRYVSSDFSQANLEIRVRMVMTSDMVILADALEEELASKPFEASEPQMTGIGALWLQLLDYIVISQGQGILLAFSAIGLLMCLIFQSVKTGLISMAPNLSPVFLTLGVMGFAGITLDYNKVFIATVAIGIAVDDTIHLVSRFRHEFRRFGNYEQALRVAMVDVGRALIITSATLVLGFSMLLFSVLASEAMFGILLSTTIVVALVADFLLMPALIVTFEPFGPEGAQAREQAPRQPAKAA